MGKLVPNAFNMAVVIFVALGSTACSYGMAVVGGTIGQPSFYKSMHLAQSGEPEYGRTADLIGAFNGVSAAGSALGALASSWFAEKYSRKRTIQGSAVVLIVGGVLCCTAVDVAMFIGGRTVNGIGIGALVTVIPMYQAEVSTQESRGFMVSMHGLMFAVGYSLSAWLAFGMYFISEGGSESSFPWRFPIAFQIAPALLLLIGSPWLPYSPRWLVSQNRFDEAVEVIKRLHKTKQDPGAVLAQQEYDKIKAQVELNCQMKKSSFEVFKTTPNRKRAAVAFFMMFNNQFTGVLVLNNYLIILFTNLGLSGYLPLLLSAIYVTSTFPGNLFCGLYVERFGRRTFTLIGLAGIVVVLSIECALQATVVAEDNKAGRIVAVLFIFLFVTPFWSFFLDATQFLYISEIFTNSTRSQGVAVGMAGYYAADIILLMVAPTGLNELGWKFLLLFVACTVANFLFVYLFCPETKNRSLEDMNALFGDFIGVEGESNEASDEGKPGFASGTRIDEDMGIHDSRVSCESKGTAPRTELVE